MQPGSKGKFMPQRVNLDQREKEDPRALANKFCSFPPSCGTLTWHAPPEKSHVAKKPAVFYCEAMTNSLTSIHLPPSLP